MYIYYTIITVASYMFQVLIVTIFREAFVQGILHKTLKEFTKTNMLSFR